MNALVFVKDVDRASGRPANKTERQSKLNEVQTEIREGFATARAEVGELIAVPATPCRMIEAWALGDRCRLQAIARGKTSPVPAGTPEAFWGEERDPRSNHPKRVLARALGREPSSADFAAIAEGANLEVLSRECPDSFATFASDVRKALASCQAGKGPRR